MVAFALFGLALLSKGPLGLLLPGLVLVLWHGSRREWRRLFELAPLALVSLAVYLPWFVACARAMGTDNIFHELYAQNFQRFVSGSRGHERPLHYYLVNIWWDLAPWSFLLPFALVHVHRARLWRDRNVQLLLWWFFAFLLFLSVAATKRQLYLLPAYPAIALLMAPWIAAVGRKGAAGESSPGTRPVRIYAFLFAAFFVVLSLVLLGVSVSVETIIARTDLNEAEIAVARAMPLPLAVTGFALLVSGVWIGLAWRRQDSRAALVRVGATTVVLFLILLALVLPAANPYKSYAPQGRWIRTQIGDETHIGMVDLRYAGRKMGAFGYYTDALVVRMERRDEVEAFFNEHPGSLVLVYEGDAEGLFAGEEAAWRTLVVRELRTGSRLYLVVRGP